MFTIPSTVQTYLDSNKNTWPVRLFEIGGDPILYFTDSDKTVSWNGQTWIPRGVSYKKTNVQRGTELDSQSISVDNIDDYMIGWALTQSPIGYTTKAYKGFTNGEVNGSGHLVLIDTWAGLLFQGRNTSLRVDTEMEFEVKSNVDLHRQRGPRVGMYPLCRFQGQDGFKGPNCGYTGSETQCNYTYRRCKELENEVRFGGFPDVTSKNDR